MPSSSASATAASSPQKTRWRRKGKKIPFLPRSLLCAAPLAGMLGADSLSYVTCSRTAPAHNLRLPPPPRADSTAAAIAAASCAAARAASHTAALAVVLASSAIAATPAASAPLVGAPHPAAALHAPAPPQLQQQGGALRPGTAARGFSRKTRSALKEATTRILISSAGDAPRKTATAADGGHPVPRETASAAAAAMFLLTATTAGRRTAAAENMWSVPAGAAAAGGLTAVAAAEAAPGRAEARPPLARAILVGRGGRLSIKAAVAARTPLLPLLPLRAAAAANAAATATAAALLSHEWSTGIALLNKAAAHELLLSLHPAAAELRCGSQAALHGAPPVMTLAATAGKAAAGEKMTHRGNFFRVPRGAFPPQGCAQQSLLRRNSSTSSKRPSDKGSRDTRSRSKNLRGSCSRTVSSYRWRGSNKRTNTGIKSRGSSACSFCNSGSSSSQSFASAFVEPVFPLLQIRQEEVQQQQRVQQQLQQSQQRPLKPQQLHGHQQRLQQQQRLEHRLHRKEQQPPKPYGQQEHHFQQQPIPQQVLQLAAGNTSSSRPPQATAAGVNQPTAEQQAFQELLLLLREHHAFLDPAGLRLGSGLPAGFISADLLQEQRQGKAPAAPAAAVCGAVSREAAEAAAVKVAGRTEGTDIAAAGGAAAAGETETAADEQRGAAAGQKAAGRIRGLFAARKYEAGELIAWVPLRLCFSEETAAWLPRQKEIRGSSSGSFSWTDSGEGNGSGKRNSSSSSCEGDVSNSRSLSSSSSEEEASAAEALAALRKEVHALVQPGGASSSSSRRNKLSTLVADSQQLRLTLLLLYYYLFFSYERTRAAAGRVEPTSSSSSTLPTSSSTTPSRGGSREGGRISWCSSSSRHVGQSSSGREDLEKLYDSTNNCTRERGRLEIWRRQFALLPAEMKHTLMFWRIRELHALEDRLVNAVVKRAAVLQQISTVLEPHIRCLSSALPAAAAHSPSPPFSSSSPSLSSLCPSASSMFHPLFSAAPSGEKQFAAAQGDNEGAGKELLQWAACLVSSRCMRLSAAAARKLLPADPDASAAAASAASASAAVVALVPLLEYVNHRGAGVANATIATFPVKVEEIGVHRKFASTAPAPQQPLPRHGSSNFPNSGGSESTSAATSSANCGSSSSGRSSSSISYGDFGGSNSGMWRRGGARAGRFLGSMKPILSSSKAAPGSENEEEKEGEGGGRPAEAKARDIGSGGKQNRQRDGEDACVARAAPGEDGSFEGEACGRSNQLESRSKGRGDQQNKAKKEDREEDEERACSTIEEGVGLVAARTIEAGEEISIQYTTLNELLLLNYGFFDTRHTEDRTFAFFTPSLASAALNSIRSAALPPFSSTSATLEPLVSSALGFSPFVEDVLKRLGLLPDPRAANARSAAAAPAVAAASAAASPVVVFPFLPLVAIGGKQLVDARLLCAARALVMEEESPLRRSFDVSKQLRWEECLSVENERAALRFLIALLKHDLHRKYSTWYEDDTALLAGESNNCWLQGASSFGGSLDSEITPNMEVAIRFRMQKKRLQKEVIGALQDRLADLPPV